jgi:integrase
LHAWIACIAPQTPENPFAHKFARERNALIVYWLLELGLRRGELLGAKIGDLDLRDNKLRIPRRADAPEDPRANQPNAKTLSRVVAISDELAALTRQYLTDRRHILGARKNPFIFVAESSGRPMSLSAFTSLFSEIRNACSALPRDFSAHSLRHTWNDYFSSAARAAGLSDSVTEMVRSALMGWSPTSGTAASYTKRSVRESATKASLEHQARIKSIKVPT